MPAKLCPEKLPANWAQPATDWSDALLEGWTTPKTVAGYALHVGWVARDLGPFLSDPWQLTPALLTGWLDTHEWSLMTRRRVISSLRSFYSWGVGEGMCQRSPLAGVSAAPPRTSGPAALPIAPAWVEPVERWSTWLRASSSSDGTLHVRRYWLRQLSETFADPWAVTADDLAQFLSRDDWAPETKRQGCTTIRMFYRWAEQEGRVLVSPARHLKTVRIPRTVPRPVTDDAVAAAFEAADSRTRLALALGVYAGLRRGEIARVHTRDIGPGTLRIKGKGGHERMVPLHAELDTLLRSEIRRRRLGIRERGWPRMPAPDGWIFPGVDPGKHLSPFTIGKMLDDVLPDGWTPHTLRHRFATQAYGVDRDLRAVQELLGHANPATTTRYAAVPDGALVAAVAGVSLPRSVGVNQPALSR